MNVDSIPQSPGLLYSALEIPRALHELSLLVPAHGFLKSLNGGKGEPVLTLPGFGADDRSTAILRSYLNRWGYQAKPWGAGQNLIPQEAQDLKTTLREIDKKIDEMGAYLETLHVESKQKVSLIGWSLGGIFALQLASRYPEIVERVITLGSPLGDFRGTAVYKIMKLINKADVSDKEFQAWDDFCHPAVKGIPITVIYSGSDGFVSPEIAVRESSALVENIEVVCSHIGFCCNPIVLNLIANRLQQSVENWQAYQPDKMNRLLYKIY